MRGQAIACPLMTEGECAPGGDFEGDAAEFTLSLRGMGIAGGEKRAGMVHWQVDRVALSYIGHVHVAAMRAGRERGDRFDVRRGAKGAKEWRPGNLPAVVPGESA